MAGMATETDRRVLPAADRAPSGWGLGDGTSLASACRASRSDLRDAVRAAWRAFSDRYAKTAMNRGHVLHRVADRIPERPEWIAAFVEMKTVRHPIGG